MPWLAELGEIMHQHSRRARLLGDVEEFLGAHPDLEDREEIAMSYITRCTRVRRA
ncbi:hypothetical protein [Nonomuraea sp. NPDC049784]|uniref:hypothetical protein n=1 Tax=Nonomuraea sp. NPDC049784 TaxID=3154361 RepID=UPI0033E5BDB1